MIERPKAILDQPQSLKEDFKTKGVFLPEILKPLAKRIDKFELPRDKSLSLSERKIVFIYILYMNDPSLRKIATLLGEPIEEIKRQRDEVFECGEDGRLVEAIHQLTEDGEVEIPWNKPKKKPLTPEFLERIKDLRVKRGLNNWEIVEVTGEPFNRVKYAVSLIKRDRIKRIRRKPGGNFGF